MKGQGAVDAGQESRHLVAQAGAGTDLRLWLGQGRQDLDQMGQGLGSQPVAMACREVVGTGSRRQSLGSLLHCGIVRKQLASGGRPGMGGRVVLPGEFYLSSALWRREVQCVEVTAWPVV